LKKHTSLGQLKSDTYNTTLFYDSAPLQSRTQFTWTDIHTAPSPSTAQCCLENMFMLYVRKLS